MIARKIYGIYAQNLRTILGIWIWISVLILLAYHRVSVVNVTPRNSVSINQKTQETSGLKSQNDDRIVSQAKRHWTSSRARFKNIKKDVIRNCCVGDKTDDAHCLPPIIPKIVHIVWFNQTGRTQFRFHHLMTVLSIIKFIKPKKIIFHGDSLPEGKWWSYLQEKNKNNDKTIIIHANAKPRTEIFGHRIQIYEHQTDILRHEIMLKYGGIYTDLDVIFVRSIDSLLCYDMVMGEELKNWLTNGIMLAKPQAPFLQEWYKMYEGGFDERTWNWISVVLPGIVWERHPEMIHVEHTSMNHPTWEKRDLDLLYKVGNLYNWSGNYCVHLWYRKYGQDLDPDIIKGLNSTVGELFRFIYYGKKELMTIYETKL